MYISGYPISVSINQFVFVVVFVLLFGYPYRKEAIVAAFGDSTGSPTSLGSQVIQAWVNRKTAKDHPEFELNQTVSFALKSEAQLESQNGRIDTQVRLRKLIRRELKLPKAQQNAKAIKSWNSQIRSYAKQAKAEAKAAAAAAAK